MRTRRLLNVVVASGVALTACGSTTPSTWDGMNALTASQIAQRIECKGYEETHGPFSPDEPPQTQAVGACEISYKYPDRSVTLHVYPSRAVGAEVRRVVGERERQRLHGVGRQRAARVRVA